MQKIEVIAQSNCMSQLTEALRGVKVGSYLVYKVQSFDLTRNSRATYRGVSYSIGVERVKLELVVAEHEVDLTIDAIQRTIAAAGQRGAKLSVSPIEGTIL